VTTSLPALTFRPYIKGLPITITTQTRLPSGGYSSQTVRPTYEDPYTLEFRELHACIVEGKEVRTSVVDARRDTELAIEIIKALK
jgi:predicted dehydrogenase